MRTQLKFNFRLPEDTTEFKAHCNAMDWYLAMDELKEWLRAQIKHYDKDYDEVWDRMFAILEERGLSFE